MRFGAAASAEPLQARAPEDTAAPKVDPGNDQNTQPEKYPAQLRHRLLRLHRSKLYSFVEIDCNQTRYARFAHCDTGQLVHRLHRRLVVRNDDELHLLGHLADDLAEATHIGIVERRVDLVEQTERSRIQLEDGEDERHGRQRLLTARQQMDRAVPLARWPRHDGDARLEQILAVELEVG